MNKPELDKEVSEILSTPIRHNHAGDWALIDRAGEFIEDKSNPRELRKRVMLFLYKDVMGVRHDDETLEKDLDYEPEYDESGEMIFPDPQSAYPREAT
jgi:hypothetical protein